MHFTTLSGLCDENFMSLGYSYSNLWHYGYCAWCHANVQKSPDNVVHINHRSADFFCLYLWQEPPIEVQFAQNDSNR